MNAIEYYQKVLTNVIKDIIIFNYLRHIKLQLKDRAHITFTFYQLEDALCYISCFFLQCFIFGYTYNVFM